MMPRTRGNDLMAVSRFTARSSVVPAAAGDKIDLAFCAQHVNFRRADRNETIHPDGTVENIENTSAGCRRCGDCNHVGGSSNSVLLGIPPWQQDFVRGQWR